MSVKSCTILTWFPCNPVLKVKIISEKDSKDYIIHNITHMHTFDL